MRLNSIFSPVQIILDKPEEVKEIMYAIESSLHDNNWSFSRGVKYPLALKLLELLRKVPLSTELT